MTLDNCILYLLKEIISLGLCQGLYVRLRQDSVGNRADIHSEAVRSSRLSVRLMPVRCVLTPFSPLHSPRALPYLASSRWQLGGGKRGMTAHTVEPQTSHCAQARQGWRSCSGAWWVTGNRAASPTLGPPPARPAVLSPRLPPPDVMDKPRPRNAFITSQWQSASCSLTPVASQNVP